MRLSARMSSPHILVAGAGAAGYFAAIAAAERLAGKGTVTLCEATAHPLAKVRISGGGRCNVTHACFEPRELIKRYPRGGRELLGAFHTFGPRDTIEWFEHRSVALKTEADGRMFPVTDDSATIVNALTQTASTAGVVLRVQAGIRSIERRPAVPNSGAAFSRATPGKGFIVEGAQGEIVQADRLILATGGLKHAGQSLPEMLGHTIEPPVPSLFTFHIDDPRLAGLAGLSVVDVVTQVRGTSLKEQGPLLVTHWGLSGPAILKLSAWGARELAACHYRFTLRVNFSPGHTRESARAAAIAQRSQSPRRQVSGACPFPLPSRLWARLVAAAGIGETTAWTQVSNEAIARLAEQVVAAEFDVTRKSTNKEEFVTCGGVRLSEVDFRTMESRVCPGLYFAGEVLDIDGITGGFNFQASWTTGWIAGRSAAGGLLEDHASS